MERLKKIIVIVMIAVKEPDWDELLRKTRQLEKKYPFPLKDEKDVTLTELLRLMNDEISYWEFD